MIYKKLIKNIENRGVVRSGGSVDYAFTLPLINQDNTISIDTTTLNKWNGYESEISTIKNDLGDLGNISNTNQQEINTIKENLTHLTQSKQDNLVSGSGINISGNVISSNIVGITPQQAQDIETNKSNIATIKALDLTQNETLQELKAQVANLVELQKNDLNFVGEIVPSKTYHLGDFGYSGVHSFWFVCNVESANGEINANWKKINQNVNVDLSNYYTKLEVEDKLGDRLLKATFRVYQEQIQDDLNRINGNTQVINDDVERIKPEIENLKLGLDDKVSRSDLTNYATNDRVETLLSEKQDKIVNGDDCGINSNNQVYLLPKWKDKINANATSISELGNIYAKLNNYSQSIKSLKYFVGKDTNYLEANGDNVILGNDGGGFSGIKNGNNYIYVNSTNAYKRVGGGDEVLASEQWVQEKINAKITRQVINKTCPVGENTTIVRNIGSYISIMTLRKRNDGLWFIYNTSTSHQVIINDNNLVLWGVAADSFTNDYQFIITYLN